MTDATEPRIRGCRITQTDLDAARGRLLALEAQMNAEIARAIDLGVRVVVRTEETEIPERPWTIVRVTVIATAQPVVGPNPELEAQA
jgi:hypothetical protein